MSPDAGDVLVSDCVYASRRSFEVVCVRAGPRRCGPLPTSMAATSEGERDEMLLLFCALVVIIFMALVCSLTLWLLKGTRCAPSCPQPAEQPVGGLAAHGAGICLM